MNDQKGIEATKKGLWDSPGVVVQGEGSENKGKGQKNKGKGKWAVRRT